MKILNKEVKILKKREFDKIYKDFDIDEEAKIETREGKNILIDNDYLIGYKVFKTKENKKIIYIYQEHTKNDKLSVRKKLNIAFSFIEKKQKNNNIVFSIVKKENKKAIKFNKYIFPFYYEGEDFIVFSNSKDLKKYSQEILDDNEFI